jgi:hypothetical protein
MNLYSTYSCKIKHYNHILKQTVVIYRSAVDYCIQVCLQHWDEISLEKTNNQKQQFVERMIHSTKNHTAIYNFDQKFYKFPSYLRRAVISEAIGKVSSYKSNLENWDNENPATRGRKSSLPKAGLIYPCLYRENMYEQTGEYTAKIKVYVRNTWDWIDIQLRKSDVDYITRHCSNRKQCAPTLQKRGRQWFLDFPFEESITLKNTSPYEQTILAVDLGINSSATIVVMKSDGAILGRHFLRLTKEYDSLTHAINRIKKAQQHGNRRMPRLWARVNGINDHIVTKTAIFIMDISVLYNADVIVFEHLDTSGKKRGSKKQKLHLWKSQYVQSIVTEKAHRLGMRVSHICACGTSKFAFDGSGITLRGKNANLSSYSVCKFQNSKIYNCDLNASYNIGARYYIREILKSLPVKVRLAIEAKVPQLAKRSTCTLSSLFNLNAELILS